MIAEEKGKSTNMNQSNSTQHNGIEKDPLIFLSLVSIISPSIDFEINQLNKMKDQYVLTVIESKYRTEDASVRSLKDTIQYIIQEYRLKILNHYEKISSYSAFARGLSIMKNFNPFIFDYSLTTLNSFPFNSKDYVEFSEKIILAIKEGNSKILFSIEVGMETIKKGSSFSEFNSYYISSRISTNELNAIRTNPKQIEILNSNFLMN